MVETRTTEEIKTSKIWIISEGTHADLDLKNICKESAEGSVTEYQISELARYLLDPSEISLKEKIVGCRIKYRRPSGGKIAGLIEKIKTKEKAPKNGDQNDAEEIISHSKSGSPAFRDEALNAHFMKIHELLKQYDPVQKKLAGLDRGTIEDITAVCEDIGGNRYQLNLQGSINEKIGFVANSLSKKAKVILSRAYLLNGLFEMRGFNLTSFNPDNSYRLIKISGDNLVRYCVLKDDYKFEYWVSDNTLVDYMHLFEQSVKTDCRLGEALALCVKGEATPLKLFFSKQPEQSYSELRLPSLYQEVLKSHQISPSEKVAIANMLNNCQSIVFFNYIPAAVTGKKMLYTNISVMHDLKALEPIKNKLPHIYSEITKKVSVSDAGRLYLLDSLRGYQSV